MSRTSTILAVSLLGAWALVVRAAEAADAPSLTVGLRMQGWYVAEQNGVPDGGTAHVFLLRRGYLFVTGKLTSTVSAFVHVAAGLDLPALRRQSLLAEPLLERAEQVAGILRSRLKVLGFLAPFRHLADAARSN